MKVRKTLLPALATAILLVSASVSGQDAPIVKSAKIIESLSAKDIVVDGGSGSPGSVRRGAIDLQVQFAFNSAELLPVGRAQLDQLAVALADRTLQVDGFEVIGHTDRVGDFGYNLKLSRERASAVKHYLVSMHGVSPARLVTAGLGFSRLADPHRPAAAINRRVEIRRLGPGQAGAAPTGPVMAPVVSPSTQPAPGGRLVPTPQ